MNLMITDTLEVQPADLVVDGDSESLYVDWRLSELHKYCCSPFVINPLEFTGYDTTTLPDLEKSYLSPKLANLAEIGFVGIVFPSASFSWQR